MYLILEPFTKLIYILVYIKNFFPRKGKMVIYATAGQGLLRWSCEPLPFNIIFSITLNIAIT